MGASNLVSIRNFRLKKISGPNKNFVVQKYFGSENNFESKNVVECKEFVSPKRSCMIEFFCPTNLSLKLFITLSDMGGEVKIDPHFF